MYKSRTFCRVAKTVQITDYSRYSPGFVTNSQESDNIPSSESDHTLAHVDKIGISNKARNDGQN